MSESKIEEIIMLLTAICALLAFLCEFKIVAIIFGAKAAIDVLIVLRLAIKEVEEEMGGA